MSDLVGNPEDRFSHNEAPFICFKVPAVEKAAYCFFQSGSMALINADSIVFF